MALQTLRVPDRSPEVRGIVFIYRPVTLPVKEVQSCTSEMLRLLAGKFLHPSRLDQEGISQGNEPRLSLGADGRAPAGRLSAQVQLD